MSLAYRSFQSIEVTRECPACKEPCVFSVVEGDISHLEGRECGPNAHYATECTMTNNDLIAHWAADIENRWGEEYAAAMRDRAEQQWEDLGDLEAER